ncbi:CAAX amino terminal protease self- immunity [Rubripirellula tenax]|uniref:CAAX amino terminal protease self-immunity n=1 Tax=Rubripirellula tenax TaxID=2528015 RepID=A0A5C6FER3_9BACT|nr:CPBP family glutamic-type intramembrane protease [Rubripirellula tenax]TWU59878.1 CAAX amino terminal protease self- immunity [Rubripirellula tenax]
MNVTNEEAGHAKKPTMGWWPYVLPIVAFLVLVEVTQRFAGGDSIAMLALRVVVPLVLLAFFWVRGEYPELRFAIDKMTPVDALLGIVLAAMWMAPYVMFPSLRPESGDGEFDPMMAGVALWPVVFGVRMIGYAMVTPWMEELFMRSFVMRYAEVLRNEPSTGDPSDSTDDFRKIPLAHFTWVSFLGVVGVFLATHQMWEWIVMLPWAVATNLWFYYRKSLFALIVVHAATNASILIAAATLSGRFGDGAGGPLSLWFLV